MSNNGNEKSALRMIILVATFGGLLYGYDTGVVNGALPYMSREDQLNLTSLTEGLVTSALLLGAAFGAVISGKDVVQPFYIVLFYFLLQRLDARLLQTRLL